MSFRDSKKVIENAKANAKYFNTNYWVFTDTSSNWRCEREAIAPKNLSSYYYVVTPDGTVTEKPAPAYYTSPAVSEAGMTMAEVGPAMDAGGMPVLTAIATEVLKAKSIYHVATLLTECLGAKAGDHIFNLLDALEVKVEKRVKEDLPTS